MKKENKNESLTTLRRMLRPGTTVYTVLRHESSSGMSRTISTYVIRNNKPFCLDHLLADANIAKLDSRHPGLTVHGTGMDMGFHLVYSLASTLYPKGHRCTAKPSCPSNDHSNDHGRLSREWAETHTSTTPERNEWIRAQPTYTKTRHHESGGYALNQKWM